MTTRQGRFGLLYVSFDGGSNFTRAPRIVDFDFDYNRDEVEETSHDSAGFREYQSGLADSMLNFSMIYDDSDPTFLQMQDSMDAGSSFAWRLVPYAGTGLPQREGTGFLTSMSESYPLDGMQTVDGSMRVSGATVRSTQA